jgi:AraC-like DNA-binding protein
MKNFCQDIHVPLFVLQLPQKTLARFGLSQQHWVDFLYERLRIDVNDSNLTDTLIGLDDFVEVFRLSRNGIGKDRFLHAYVEDIRARHMGAIGLAMEAAPTIDDSLSIWLDNMHLLAPMLRITPRDTADERVFELSLAVGLGDISHTFMEMVALMTAAIIRNLSCGTVNAQLQFAHARDLPESFYRDSFGLEPVFEAPVTALRFARGEIGKGNDYYAPLLYRQALRGIDALRESIGNHLKLSHRVRQFLIRSAEQSVFPLVEDAAGYFNTSVRTFTRRLQDEGSSFRDLRNGIQLDIAKQLLRKSPLPIKSIVERTGFSNPAAFSRAFHAAVGLTPMAYRRGAEA